MATFCVSICMYVDVPSSCVLFVDAELPIRHCNMLRLYAKPSRQSDAVIRVKMEKTRLNEILELKPRIKLIILALFAKLSCHPRRVTRPVPCSLC